MDSGISSARSRARADTLASSTMSSPTDELAATRVLRSLLFEVLPSDPLTFVAILTVLALAVLAASWIPARRAATIHPSEALRKG
jgi:ABC-type lipoprotein release transport system permease subunit